MIGWQDQWYTYISPSIYCHNCHHKDECSPIMCTCHIFHEDYHLLWVHFRDGEIYTHCWHKHDLLYTPFVMHIVYFIVAIRGSFYLHGLTLFPALIAYHIPTKIWDGITYPFPNFNSCTIDVWEWISDFVTLYNGCNDFSLLVLHLINISKMVPHCDWYYIYMQGLFYWHMHNHMSVLLPMTQHCRKWINPWHVSLRVECTVLNSCVLLSYYLSTLIAYMYQGSCWNDWT